LVWKQARICVEFDKGNTFDVIYKQQMIESTSHWWPPKVSKLWKWFVKRFLVINQVSCFRNVH